MHLSADKGESRRRATQLFPDYADQWTRVKDDGRAEAALLAFYLAKGFDQ
jgi:crossover junction endodeoxyribonuclease RuvC